MFLSNKCAMHTLPLAQLFIATGLAAYPALSHISATIFFAYVINTFLIEVSFKVLAKQVTASYLGKDCFSNVLDNKDTNLLGLI